MEMKEILNYLFNQNNLTKSEAREILTRIGKGEFSESEMSAFITVYLMREITPPELSGFREALLSLCVPVNLNGMNTIDVCGTGGDEKNTFNISTLTSFVLAGAGIKVVKHGNYGVSSGCGSSNIFEYFGYKLSNNEDKLNKELESVNICYMHAPLFHPAMKHVAPVRKSLKVKTFFNLLGPMVNPSRPKNQMVGVYNRKVQDLFHQVYKELDINYCIIYSLDGYDEISLTNEFRSVTDKEDKIYHADMLKMHKTHPDDLFGGDTVEHAASIFTGILEGNGSKSQVNVVLANAAFAIQCYYPEKTLEEGLSIARESLESKNALKVFKKLIEIQ